MKVQPYEFDIGDVIHIKRPRYNINDYFRIIGMREDHATNKTGFFLFA